jgi:hypothetical protein
MLLSKDDHPSERTRQESCPQDGKLVKREGFEREICANKFNNRSLFYHILLKLVIDSIKAPNTLILVTTKRRSHVTHELNSWLHHAGVDQNLLD